jgi:EAL domain-containing protein (putative c-di-GMP-specific phosphodiesterase class I)
LPVDEIKIDKSFVLHMERDESDATIVRSIVDLGRNLGIRVVAEGVENASVWQRLAAMGCDVIQGYVLAKPLHPVELEQWLNEGGAGVHGPARELDDEATADILPLRPPAAGR